MGLAGGGIEEAARKHFLIPIPSLPTAIWKNTARLIDWTEFRSTSNRLDYFIVKDL